MYHAHFRGTHYDAGYRWGSLLFKHQNIILENIPFEITRKRMDYAMSCLPVYENIILKSWRKFRESQTASNVMSAFYRPCYLVCMPYRRSATVPVLHLPLSMKFFLAGTVIF